mgnify:CR=1 FL=1|tara:strand:- start:744 stop:1076 length:333 start_codon:yes stop_codon:yes gene_type:complete
MACWDGYEKKGMKKKGSKTVPNCVKTSALSLRKTTKGKGRNFLSIKEGAGMTKAGRAKYKKQNPGSTLSAPVTGKVKAGSKDAKRRKSFCARSKKWKGKRGIAARKRWKC